MMLNILAIEIGRQSSRQPSGPFADCRDVTTDITERHLGAVVETMNFLDPRRRTNFAFPERKIGIEVWKTRQPRVLKPNGRGISIAPLKDIFGVCPKDRLLHGIGVEARTENDEISLQMPAISRRQLETVIQLFDM